MVGAVVRKVLLSLVLGLAIIIRANAQSDSLMKPWYNHPARQWVEALPLGNGRLGAMV